MQNLFLFTPTLYVDTLPIGPTSHHVLPLARSTSGKICPPRTSTIPVWYQSQWHDGYSIAAVTISTRPQHKSKKKPSSSWRALNSSPASYSILKYLRRRSEPERHDTPSSAGGSEADHGSRKVACRHQSLSTPTTADGGSRIP